MDVLKIERQKGDLGGKGGAIHLSSSVRYLYRIRNAIGHFPLDPHNQPQDQDHAAPNVVFYKTYKKMVVTSLTELSDSAKQELVASLSAI
eukprot:scaffold12694_cov46-Attheya_sp.AAC.5